MEKEIEKELENPEKRKRESSPVGPLSPARPRARAPALPDRRTPAVSGSSPLPRALSLPCSLPARADLLALVFLRQRALLLSLSRGPGSPVPSRCPRASPFLSLCHGPSLSDPPSPRVAVDRRMRTRARRRVSRPRRPPTRPTLFL
jgi:hypothetical protein